MGPHHLEDFLAIFAVGLIAGRAQRRRRGLRHSFKIFLSLLAEIDQVLIDDPAHAMKGAVNGPDAGMLAGFQGNARQGLIDDSRRTAALGDEYFLKHELAPALAADISFLSLWCD